MIVVAYQKQTWRDYDDNKTELQNLNNGALVTPERMNHIETGIANSVDQSTFEQNKFSVEQQLQQKPDYTQVRKNTADKPINVSEMDTETKKLFTGGSVPVVGEKAVGNENLKSKSVSFDKTTDDIRNTVGQVYYGKFLFDTMGTEPIVGGTASVGWGMGIKYSGEIINAVRAFIPVARPGTEIIASVRSVNYVNTILLKSNPVTINHTGYYTFLFDEPISEKLIYENLFVMVIHSPELSKAIYNSGERWNTTLNDRVSGVYQVGGGGSLSFLNGGIEFGMQLEFLGSYDLSAMVENDSEYQTMKESTKSLEIANRLFASRTDNPVPSTYTSSFFGWATPVTYYGERITSTEIYLNMNSYNGEVISTIRDEDMNILATSLPVKPEENKLYTFSYDNKINNRYSDVIIVTIESVGNTDIIRQPFADMATGENRLINGAQYKFKSSSGNWVDVSSNTSLALYAIFYNNDITEAFNNKVDRPKETHIKTLPFPERFYTVSNDIDYNNENERHFALPVYTEYLANTYHNMVFENGLDREYLISDELSSDTELRDVELIFGAADFVGDNTTTAQQITKASVPNKKSFVLTIGDSVTAQNMYWRFANELFEKEAIDFDRDNNVTFVGTANKRLENEIDYKGVQKTIYASAEGRSGWDGLSFFRYSTVRRPSQATWDLLGLGDGSGTDYTGLDEQIKLIQKTNEVNDSVSPNNPFFDNNKSGNNRFSIPKWLERYKTLDDDGNRLELGKGTGTLITADNIDQIDACTPTHIVLALGHNDLASQGLDAFYEYMQEWISEIKAQLPDVTILVVLSIPRIGLWDKSRYPNFYGIPSLYNLATYHDNVNIWLDHFKDIKEEEEKLFLLPQFYVTPSAEAFNTIEHVDSSGNKIYQKIGDDKHPGYRAHLNWGFQLYALLKYTMTL